MERHLALTREETLKALGCMGVDIPPDTKLADDILEKRLRDALNAAQYLHHFTLPLDFGTLSDWPTNKPGNPPVPARRRLLEAVRRGNFSEAESTLRNAGRAPELFVDPFMDMRQSLMSLGNYLDTGHQCVVMQDHANEHTINIRVRRTPLVSSLLRLEPVPFYL